MRAAVLSFAVVVSACRGKSVTPTANAGSGSAAVRATAATPAIVAPGGPPRFAGWWRIKGYDVELPAIGDLALDEYDALFGLKLGAPTKEDYERPDATVDIETNCEGLCEPETYEEVVRTKLAKRLEEDLTREVNGGTVEWVQKPVQLGDRWWMELRVVRDHVEREQAVVAMWAPHVTDGWLQCMVDVRGAGLERMKSLLDTCKALRWRAADPEGDFAPPFGHRFAVEGFTFALSPPPGFKLRSYNVRHFPGVKLGGPDVFDRLDLTSDCYGTCDAAEIRANLDKAFAEDAKPAPADQPPFELVERVHEIAPNRWVQRRHYAPWKSFPEEVKLEVRALRPGADRYMTCALELTGASVTRADELQKLCLATLQGW